MSIDGSKLFASGLGALGVISGVHLKNTSKSLKNPGNMKTIGTGLFVGGWVAMAYSLRGTSWRSVKSVLSFVAIMFIVVVVMNIIISIMIILINIIIIIIKRVPKGATKGPKEAKRMSKGCTKRCPKGAQKGRECRKGI